MNLIRHTLVRTSLLLLPLVVIGGLMTFYVFRVIANDEIDEFLLYEMNRIQKYHAVWSDVPDINSIVRVYDSDIHFEPFFSDTLLLETGDMEMVPYRELHFAIEHHQDFIGIVIHHLMLGNDDILEGALLLMSGITMLVLVLFVPGSLLVTRSVWKPFFLTLSQIRDYKPDQAPPKLPESSISEFTLLNNSLYHMLQKISVDYNRTKDFNANAAHELQTQLALIRSANESLINRLESDEEALIIAQKTQTATTRLSHMLRSLLLLSKIGNREFAESTSVDIAAKTERILDNFVDIANHRELVVRSDIQPVILKMDTGLAELMLTNVIKNAIMHNISGGYLHVDVSTHRFCVQNTGNPLQEHPEEMLKRFHKGKHGNMGLGLSIVHEICTLYRFGLSYTVTDAIHTVTISFNPSS